MYDITEHEGTVRLKIDLAAFHETIDGAIKAQKAYPDTEDTIAKWKQVESKREEMSDFLATESAAGQQLGLDITKHFPVPYRDSIAFEAFHASFGELIKNSIDACTTRKMENPEAPSMVEININCRKLAGKDSLSLTIDDNGPGFPLSALESLEKLKRGEAQPSQSEKKQFSKEAIASADSPTHIKSPVFLGGNGIGLKGLIKTVDHTKREGLSEDACSTHFANKLDDSGAIRGTSITITSPISTPKLAQAAAPTAGGMNMAAIPKRKKKKLGANKSRQAMQEKLKATMFGGGEAKASSADCQSVHSEQEKGDASLKGSPSP